MANPKRPNSWSGQPVIEDPEGTYVACSNERHPDGPWHRAASVPYSWDWPERIAQRLRTKAHGCACPSTAGEATWMHDRFPLVVTTTLQAGGAPIIDTGVVGGGVKAYVLVVRRRQTGDGWRLRRANPEADPARAVGIGQARETPPRWWLAVMAPSRLARWRRRGSSTPMGTDAGPAPADDADLLAELTALYADHDGHAPKNPSQLRDERDLWRKYGHEDTARAIEEARLEAIREEMRTAACMKCHAPNGSPYPCPVPGVYSGDLHQWAGVYVAPEDEAKAISTPVADAIERPHAERAVKCWCAGTDTAHPVPSYRADGIDPAEG